MELTTFLRYLSRDLKKVHCFMVSNFALCERGVVE